MGQEEREEVIFFGNKIPSKGIAVSTDTDLLLRVRVE
jgi:hypothetical protein